MQMYFIAHVLPEELNKRILAYKHHMLEKFSCKVGLKSPAHITLIPPFWMDEQKEAQLLADTDSIYESVDPFPVSTHHFSAFKPRTIFIDVVVDEALAALKQRGDIFFKSHPYYGIKVETRPFHPHITIATRDLHKKSFFEAWPLYQHELFKETWMADAVSVLRHNK
ncbi:MAG TPA: 2'-5' RNA ligase family protein, partial [Flavisolibacter sp.]|nr:2'-5' RNA ligase family protein [Flavisolibacter sp.]